ncbi:MAG: hypothetical protein ACRCU0_03000 [Candidatus Rhabdochlamydia sp.]
MNIGNGLNAIGRFTVDTSLSVYGFGRDTFAKGCSVCSSLAARIIQIAGKAIPNAVSNTVKANPKSFCFAAGVIASGTLIGTIAYRALSNNKKATENFLSNLRSTLAGNDPTNTQGLSKEDQDNALAFLDSKLSKHAS